MATLTHGGTLPDSAAKSDFYNIIDNATVTAIVNADIAAGAAIADTKLAAITTSGKVNTSALTTASAAQGDVLYHDGSNWVRLAAGTDGQFLKTQGAAANPAWASAGKIVQVVNTTLLTSGTTSTAIPEDDTIPQNTEGAQIMTRSITPTNASSTLLIYVVIGEIQSNSTSNLVAALFKDTGANAVACAVNESASYNKNITLMYSVSAGGTSAITYKVRVGASAGTVTWNGSAGSREYGGVATSGITIYEILP